MIFSLPQHRTAGLIFLNLLVLFIIYSLLRKSLKTPYFVQRSNRNIAIVFMFVFVLFSFWGEDWFHYLEGYPELLNGSSGHMEEAYVWIAQHLSFGYISFRFAVWGTGLIFLLLTIKRLRIKQDLALLFFGSLWIIWFSYARVSLGLSLCFFGLSLLYNPYKNRTVSYIIAISCISCSYLFHKSVFVLIIEIILTIISLRLNRKLILLFALLSLPLILSFIRSGITELLLLDFDSSNGGLEKSMYFGQYYLENANSKGIRAQGLGAKLASVLGAIPYYLLLIQSVKVSFRSRNSLFSKDIQVFIRLHMFIVFVATLFLFNLGVGTSVLFTRFMRFAAFPNAIVLAVYWEHGFYPKLTKWTYYLAILSTLYSVTYSLYLSY